jgi:PleD family two-component response regulator
VCRSCIVYLARAQNCYRLAELGEEAGHRLKFCKTECGDCPYYQVSHSLAVTMLVITRDEALTRRLATQTDVRKVTLRFARSGYESSTVIAAFRPAVIVLDSDLPEVREGPLAESIMQDERIAGATVFVACREGDKATVAQLATPTIAAPFTAEQIEQLAERLVETRGSAPRDVA